jgi:hypothetical protein
MRSLFALVVVLALAPAEAAAQQPSPPPLPSRVWLTIGAAFATLHGDCQTCEADSPYRHDGSVLGNAGYRVNQRMDVGAEVFWVPMGTAAQGTIRTTHFDGVAQFRPWASQGFFMKGGAGMAYVRNWLDTTSSESLNSKALSLVIGAGWEFMPLRRVGFQVFGSQHVAAMGDLATIDGDIPDVVGNFWSFGAAIVIR